MTGQHKHIIKLCSDQHSPFVTGFSGDALIRTPNIDYLAKNGIVFNNHYANNPVCVPGRYSMLSGNLPREIGCLYFEDTLPLETQTYMRHFSQYGYMTTCVGKMHFQGPEQMYGWMYRPFGDMEVFNHHKMPGYSPEKDVVKEKKERKDYGNYGKYQLMTAGPGTDQFMLFDISTTREAVLNLKNYFQNIIDKKYNIERPLLYEISWKTPHCPYIGLPDLYQYYRERIKMSEKLPDKAQYESLPPYIKEKMTLSRNADITEEMILNARSAYYALVEFADMQIGIVLQALQEVGIADDCYILYTSDHGEMIGNHGMWQKSNFYEESVRVPMIISGPGLPKGSVITHNTSHIDIFPTLCDLANLPPPSNVRGESMLQFLNDTAEDNRIIFSEVYASRGKNKCHALMAKKKHMKYIYYTDGSVQLFDLKTDPDEMQNVAENPEYHEIRKELHRALATLPKPWRHGDDHCNIEGLPQII